ncbi:MAG: globin domain-containing protein [Pseudomonadota bacterium]
MHLTDDEKKKIRASYALIKPEADRVSELFYPDLFNRAPKLRKLFPDDMREQGMRFMAAIAFIIDNLDDEAELNRRLDLLAEGHAPFKLLPMDYREMQEALIDSIAEALKSKFTDDVQLAWRSAFDQICNEMIKRSGTELAT